MTYAIFGIVLVVAIISLWNEYEMRKDQKELRRSFRKPLSHEPEVLLNGIIRTIEQTDLSTEQVEMIRVALAKKLARKLSDKFQ